MIYVLMILISCFYITAGHAQECGWWNNFCRPEGENPFPEEEEINSENELNAEHGQDKLVHGSIVIGKKRMSIHTPGFSMELEVRR